MTDDGRAERRREKSGREPSVRDGGRPRAETAATDDSVDEGRDRTGSTDGGADEEPDMGDLLDELSELEDAVDSPEEREQVRETMRVAMDVRHGGVLGRVVHGFDVSDAAESVLGALLFGIPMFVEGGTAEVGEFIAARPPSFAFTVGLGVGLVIGILYVADIQDVRVRNPILGVIPRKLVGVLSLSVLTATVMMTAWGRVDWADPWLAVCQIAVAFVPMAIGAALGDILPG